MLSGVSTEEEAVSLRDRLSAGELIQILKTLQQTAAGFTRGGKNRLDGELCLIRLCEPALSLEPEAINARLTRLEEAAASGVRLQQAARQEPTEERPPVPDDAEAPPESAEPESLPQEAPVGFWADLSSRVRGELGPPVGGFFTPAPDAPVQGVLKGDWLELQCVNGFVRDMVNKPEILQRIGQCASGMLGRPVQVRVTDLQAKPKTGENLQALLEFGKNHSDIIKVKN